MLVKQKTIPFDATGFLAEVSSSESLLLLEEAALLAGFFSGVDVDNGFIGATVGFFFLSSSLDESESDEVSFFLFCAETELFAVGVTSAIEGTNL